MAASDSQFSILSSSKSRLTTPLPPRRLVRGGFGSRSIWGDRYPPSPQL